MYDAPQEGMQMYEQQTNTPWDKSTHDTLGLNFLDHAPIDSISGK